MRHSTVTNTFTSLKAIGTFLFGNFEAFEATFVRSIFQFFPLSKVAERRSDGGVCAVSLREILR